MPEYVRHSGAFLRATDDLIEAAKLRDLEAASLGFISLSTSCVSCHRYIARARIARASSAVRSLMCATSRLLLGLLLSSGLLATTAGCASPPEVPAQDQRAPQPTLPAQYDTQTVTVVLPAGDTQAGRQVFRDLKCTVCHRVVVETTFPAPVSGRRTQERDPPSAFLRIVSRRLVLAPRSRV